MYFVCHLTHKVGLQLGMQQSSNIPAADVALLLHQSWQSNVIVRFVCLYETQKRTSTKHGRHGQGDPLEVPLVVIRSRIPDHFSISVTIVE